MSEIKYECTEVAVPSFGWPPGQTERTAMSHAFVDPEGVRQGTRCQCGKAVVGDDHPVQFLRPGMTYSTEPGPSSGE